MKLNLKLISDDALSSFWFKWEEVRRQAKKVVENFIIVDIKIILFDKDFCNPQNYDPS